MKKLPKKISLKKQCDNLWSQCVKLRAGNKSELSGKTKNLHAHHFFGKPNYRLRYELDNGICLTSGEHFYVAHVQGRAHLIEEVFRKRLGEKRHEEMKAMSSGIYKTHLSAVKLYLEQELKKLGGKK